jgi:transcriptional regulator with XRE-family HTH domain
MPNARASTLDADESTSSTREREVVDEAIHAPRSEGQRLLQLVPGSLAQIGEACGTSKQAVKMWRDGVRTPEPRFRRALGDAYKIPPASWDRVPSSYATGDEEDDQGDDGAPEPTVLEDSARRLKRLRRALADKSLLPREHIALDEAFSRALAMKAKFERDAAMLETRTIREHSEWKRLKRIIIEALIAHPAASKAVEEAITRVLGDDADGG